jgi:protein HIRA/HIR1
VCIALRFSDGKIRLWDTAPILDPAIECDQSVAKLVSTLSLHTGAVLCVRWSNGNGRLLASGSDDSKIVIWDHDKSAGGPVGPAFGETGSVNVESWRAIKVLFGHESGMYDDHAIHPYYISTHLSFM